MEIKFNNFIFYKYSIKNWQSKKIKLLQTYEKCNNHLLDNVITNWSTSVEQKNFLKNQIHNILHEEINLFKGKDKLLYKFDSAWFQKYEKNMNHDIHNHGFGYSAIVYIKYDPKVHFSTSFIDEITNEEYCPNIEEGDIIFFNSTYNHLCRPNKVEKERIICSFNLKLNYN
jgi:hypothetical protein